jgi:hypothetical protein
LETLAMSDAFSRLIAREVGGGGDGGQRGRPRGPRRRPSFMAHPATWWEPETIAGHLDACRTGRDGTGAWKPWDELTEAEQWAWMWEEFDWRRMVPTEHTVVEVP